MPTPPEIAKIQASFPDAIQGDVLAKLNALRGLITHIEQEDELHTAIRGTLPERYFVSFRDWAESFSEGQGSVSEDQT